MLGGGGGLFLVVQQDDAVWICGRLGLADFTSFHDLHAQSCDRFELVLFRNNITQRSAMERKRERKRKRVK